MHRFGYFVFWLVICTDLDFNSLRESPLELIQILIEVRRGDLEQESVEVTALASAKTF